jgi:hypothetical protein
MATIPYLPLEVLTEVATYLPDDDLLNYRLVNKAHAAAGARERFSVLAFHASSSSVQRLLDIAKDDHLRKCVKYLVWDSNMWDTGVDQLHNYRDLDEHVENLPRNIRRHWHAGITGRKEALNGVRDGHQQSHQRIWKARYEDKLDTLRDHLYPGQAGFAALLVNFPHYAEFRYSTEHSKSGTAWFAKST